MTLSRLRFVPVLVGAVLALAAAPSARAGDYVAWSCTNGAGASVPTTGWTATDGLGSGGATLDTCARPGGGLVANFAGTGTVGGGRGNSWNYAPPPGTTLTAATLDRSWFTTHNGPDTDYVSAGITLSTGSTVVENCQAFLAGCYTANGQISFAAQGGIHFDAGCYGDPDTSRFSCTNAPNGRAVYTVTRARLTLNDPTPPTGAAPTLPAGPLAGRTSLSFPASDVGSGVWAAQVAIDDTVVAARQAVGPNLPTCTLPARDAGFDATVPCTGSVTPTLAFDTTRVPNGTHTLVVTVWDAAGNATALPAKPVTVDNPAPPVAPAPPVPNGSGGDLGSARLVPTSRKTRVTVGVGRTVKLTGHLVDGAGHPIAGATVGVTQTVALPGAAASQAAPLTTDAKGAYVLRIKPTSSRAVVLSYAPVIGGAPTSTVAVDIGARVGVSLHLSRSRVRVGGVVAFRGTITVDPQPAGGARVLIEAWDGRRWALASVRRTDRRGHFTYSHRFRLRGAFRFRARVLSSVTLAARPGSSALRPLRIG